MEKLNKLVGQKLLLMGSKVYDATQLETEHGKAGWLDPKRIYDSYFKWNEYKRNQKQIEGK